MCTEAGAIAGCATAGAGATCRQGRCNRWQEQSLRALTPGEPLQGLALGVALDAPPYRSLQQGTQ